MANVSAFNKGQQDAQQGKPMAPKESSQHISAYKDYVGGYNKPRR